MELCRRCIPGYTLRTCASTHNDEGSDVIGRDRLRKPEGACCWTVQSPRMAIRGLLGAKGRDTSQESAHAPVLGLFFRGLLQRYARVRTLRLAGEFAVRRGS